MDIDFFTGWFYRLSSGDTVTFFVVIGFIVILSIQYAMPAKRKRQKPKKKRTRTENTLLQEADTSPPDPQLLSDGEVTGESPNVTKNLAASSDRIKLPDNL